MAKRGLGGIPREYPKHPSKYLPGKSYWGYTYYPPPKEVSEGLHTFKRKDKPVVVFSEPTLTNQYFAGPASVLPTINKYPKKALTNLNMVWSGSPVIESRFGSNNDIAGYYQPGAKPVIHLSEYAFLRTLPHEIAHHVDNTKSEHHPKRWNLGRAFAPSEHGRKNDEEDYAETISFLQTEGKPQFKGKYETMFMIHRLNPNAGNDYDSELRTPQPKEKYTEEHAKRVDIFEHAVKNYGVPRRVNTLPQSPEVPKAYRAGKLEGEIKRTYEDPGVYEDRKSSLLYTEKTSPTQYYRRQGMEARAKINSAKEYAGDKWQQKVELEGDYGKVGDREMAVRNDHSIGLYTPVEGSSKFEKKPSTMIGPIIHVDPDVEESLAFVEKKKKKQAKRNWEDAWRERRPPHYVGYGYVAEAEVGKKKLHGKGETWWAAKARLKPQVEYFEGKSNEYVEDEKKYPTFKVPLKELDLRRMDAYPEEKTRERDYEQINNLVSSVERGDVMTPVQVRKGQDGKYVLVDGYHRYLAYKSAGAKDIPAYDEDTGVVIPEEEIIVDEMDLNLKGEEGPLNPNKVYPNEPSVKNPKFMQKEE